MLKLQYCGHLMPRANSLEKTPMLGKIDGKRRRGPQRMRWIDNVADSRDMNLRKLREIVKDRGAWCAAVYGVAVRHDLVTEQQQQSPKYSLRYRNKILFYMGLSSKMSPSSWMRKAKLREVR